MSIVAENALAFAVRDKFPVRPLHTLVIPKRHVADVFQTEPEEREASHQLASLCCERIRSEDEHVGGFNFGSNVGKAAEQTIFHAHVHVIPRRVDDAELAPAKPD